MVEMVKMDFERRNHRNAYFPALFIKVHFRKKTSCKNNPYLVTFHLLLHLDKQALLKEETKPKLISSKTGNLVLLTLSYHIYLGRRSSLIRCRLRPPWRSLPEMASCLLSFICTHTFLTAARLLAIMSLLAPCQLSSPFKLLTSHYKKYGCYS